MMRNPKLGEDVAVLVLELWPMLATKWSAREREVLVNRVASIPIDFEQAEAAIVNFKCSFQRSWPSVGQVCDVLSKAVSSVSEEGKTAKYINIDPAYCVSARKRTPEWENFTDAQVCLETYAGFPPHTFDSLNQFRRQLDHDLRLFGVPEGELSRQIQYAREEAEKTWPGKTWGRPPESPEPERGGTERIGRTIQRVVS